MNYWILVLPLKFMRIIKVAKYSNYQAFNALKCQEVIKQVASME